MKKILVIFAIAMLFLGCNVKYAERPLDSNNERFQLESSQWLKGGYVYIIVDKETGVKYMFYKNGYGAGLTKLEE